MVVMLVTASNLTAQVHVGYKSNWFYIENGTNVHIKGSLTTMAGNTTPVINLGQLSITDSVTCNNATKLFGLSPDTLTADVRLIGTSHQTISGNSMRFGRLSIQNSYDSLTSFTNFEVTSSITLDSGNLYMETTELDLMATGKIINETNSSRIYTNEYGTIHTGRALLNGNTYPNIAGTGLGITINGNLGVNVDVYRKNVQQLTVANGSIDRFYTFTPQINGFVSAPTIYYLDTIELNGFVETGLSFFNSTTDGTSWTNMESIVNDVTDIVNENTNTPFQLTTNSMFTLAENVCNNPPYLHFVQDTVSSCNGDLISIIPDGISGNASVWSTNEINTDSIFVSTSGTYTVTIQDLKGCISSDSIVVIISPKPTMSYTATTECLGYQNNFTNTSTISSGTATYFWDFNDLFTATVDTTSINNPNFTYTTQGVYDVILTGTSDKGCMASVTNQVTVLPSPFVSFNIIDNCADSSIIFQNFSVTNPVEPVTFLWDFGNGDTSTDSIPNYGFTTNGTYVVTLTTSTASCNISVIKNIEIFPNPVASFTTPGACEGNVVSFTNTSTVATGTINNSWIFSAGNSSNLLNPTSTFNFSDTYPVLLTTTTDKGCVDSVMQNVEIQPTPIPTYTANAVCLGETTNFINTSNVTSTFVWDFGNSNTSTVVSPSETFITTGLQNIMLTETSAFGCVGTLTNTVMVNVIPTANFSTVIECATQDLDFTNNSIVSPNATYHWDFGNGDTSIVESPTTIYPYSQNFTVELIVNDNNCLNTITQTVFVNPLPIVHIGDNITTCGTQYVLDAQNVGSAYLWSDATTNQTITVTTDDTYWLAVTDANSCINYDTVTVALNTTMVPDIGTDTLFCNSGIIDAGYPLSTYTWSTGETTHQIEVTTSNTYSVTIVDQNGCTGQDDVIVEVVTAIVPNLGLDQVNCEFLTVVLSPTELGYDYVWNTGATTETINAIYTDTYWVDLTDNNNCVTRDSVYLYFTPGPALDLGLDGAYCNTINYDITQPNVSYQWEDGSTNPIRTVAIEGSYWAELIDLTTTCVHRDSIDVTFLPNIIIDLGVDLTLCSGEFTQFDAMNDGSIYTWSVGDTTQIITVSSSGDYSVIVTSPDGCSETDTVNVVIRPTLNTDLGEDVLVCTGGIVNLNSPQIDVDYTWYYNGGLLNENTATITVSDIGEYSVEVTDVVGCIAVDTIEVQEIFSELTADFLVISDNVYVGDTIKFVNLSYPNIQGVNWDFDDGFYSTLTSPTHVYYFEADYDVTLTVSDSNCVKEITKTIILKPALPNQPDSLLGTNDIVELILYPNPNNGQFTVEIELGYDADVTLYLIDVIGQIQNIKQASGQNITVQYNNTDLDAGSYFLQVILDQQIKYIQLIIN